MSTSTPVTVTQTSAKGTLNKADWIRVALATILTPVIPIISETFSKGSLTLDWKAIGAAAGLGFVTLLTTSLGSSSKTIITGTTEGTTMSLTAPAPGTKTMATANTPTTSPLKKNI